MRLLAILIVTTTLAAASGVIAKPLPAKPLPKPGATLQAPAKALPIFSFMGHDTETVYTESAFKPRCTLNATQCTERDRHDISAPLRALGQCRSINQVGKTECTNRDYPQVAGKTMKWVSMNYFNGKLYSIYGSAINGSYGDLLSAFTEKYGPPTSMGAEKWQAQSGATFSNMVSRWKFKGGELQLSALGLDLNSCAFQFDSIENSPPADHPKIDF